MDPEHAEMWTVIRATEAKTERASAEVRLTQVRMEALQSKVDETATRVVEIHQAMVGKPGNGPGFAERLRAVEKNRADAKRLRWVVLVAAVTAAFNIAILILTAFSNGLIGG